MQKTAFATALITAFAAADNVHDDAKIAGLVEGFFIGAFDFHGMTDIGHCVSDANPVEQHFENAMRGFWNGSYQEATKAVDSLGLAVSDIGDMLDHCGKIDHHDYEQIQRMAEAFLHPKQILLEATESLIINGVNVFEDTREGLHDYRLGKWLDAGEHFGQASAMLLYGKTQMVDHEELFYDFDNHWQELLDQIDLEKDEKMHKFEAMKSSNVHFTFFRMGKILEGLLAGSVEAEVPHGVECLRDAKHIWERLGGVEDQMKQGSFNTMLHAIEDLGHVIHDIANELEECKATVGTDLDKLREMSKAFTDPWYFIFHVEHDLIVNGQDIHHEIMDAQAQWENQHFYEYGHSLGLALSKIFLGGQMKNGIPQHNLPNKAKKSEDNYFTHYHHATEGAPVGASYGHTTVTPVVAAPRVGYHHYANNSEEKDDNWLIAHGGYVSHTPYGYGNESEKKDDNYLVRGAYGAYHPYPYGYRHFDNESEKKDDNYLVGGRAYYGRHLQAYPYHYDNKGTEEKDDNYLVRRTTTTSVHHPYGYYDNEGE